jgi:hypothetical protein
MARLSVLLLALPLALLGCDSSGGGSGGGGSSTTTGTGTTPAAQFTTATTTGLANQSFTFASGLNQTFAARFGLPASQAFTLQFGTFTGQTAPMSLDSAGQTATGTVTLGSCTLRFDQSGFRSGQGPQAGTQVLADPCEVETTQRILRLTDPQSRDTATSTAGTSTSRLNVAFVLTADPRNGVGSYSTVDLSTRNVTKDIRRGGVSSDAVARAFGGKIYVVNRLNADNIQIIDPAQGFTTPANAQVSTGNGTNPQDIAFVSGTRAYVSRLEKTARLLILNPTTLATLGELDLSARIKASDHDGSPEPTYMLVLNGLLYVTLQHLDNFVPVAPGEIVVIDPSSDRVVTVITLPFTNPLSPLHFSPTLKRILVSCVGNFGVNDGGIVAIDPSTNTVDANLRITEDALGGDITDFEIVSSTKGVAVISDASFRNAVMTFNPSTGQRIGTLIAPASTFIPHLVLNSRNELYMAVRDLNTPTPGVRVFDAVTDRDLVPGTLNVGQLPPIWTVFLE